MIVAHLEKARLTTDLGQDDFAKLRAWMAKKWGPVRVGDFMQHIRCVFKYAGVAELIPAPMRFGPGIARSTNKTLRLEKAKRGPKRFGL